MSARGGSTGLLRGFHRADVDTGLQFTDPIGPVDRAPETLAP